jgi:hypothetical protein
MSPTFSALKSMPRKKPACCLLYAGFYLDLSTLKMEAACSSETSVDFQWTTGRYIQEDRTLLFKNKFGSRIDRSD